MGKRKGEVKLFGKLKIKNKQGQVIAEVDFVYYAGLLAKAHEEGLVSLETRLVQAPTADNGRMCIFEATARLSDGEKTEDGSYPVKVFTCHGNATPDNVGAKIRPHFVRMAETRAKARALRDAVNVGTVCLEELGDLMDDEDDDAPPRPAQEPQQRTTTTRPTTPEAMDLKTAKREVFDFVEDRRLGMREVSNVDFIRSITIDLLGKPVTSIEDVEEVRRALEDGVYSWETGEKVT